MNANDLKLGTRFDFEIVTRQGNKIGLIYISQLLNIIDLDHITIACPIYEARLLSIAPSTRIRLTFIHPEEGAVCFYAAVAGRSNQGNIVTLDVEIISEFERIQRRNFYRLGCMLDVLYRILPDDPGKEHNDPSSPPDAEPDLSSYKKTIMKNISGSGACIVTKDIISKGTLVEVLVSFDECSPQTKLTCKVARITDGFDSRYGSFLIGMQFHHIPRKEQEQVVKFVYEQQKKLLRLSAMDE